MLNPLAKMVIEQTSGRDLFTKTPLAHVDHCQPLRAVLAWLIWSAGRHRHGGASYHYCIVGDHLLSMG